MYYVDVDICFKDAHFKRHSSIQVYQRVKTISWFSGFESQMTRVNLKEKYLSFKLLKACLSSKHMPSCA